MVGSERPLFNKRTPECGLQISVPGEVSRLHRKDIQAGSDAGRVGNEDGFVRRTISYRVPSDGLGRGKVVGAPRHREKERVRWD